MLYQQIKGMVDRYIVDFGIFMGIDFSPHYELQLKEVSLTQAEVNGIDAPATTRYLIDSKKHILWIATNLPVEKYIVFHELTHMLDSELYIKGSKIRKMGLGGYTEYHASQIGFVELLGADDLKSIKPFSMNDICVTISGNKSVLEYVQEKQQLAISMFSRKDFPANIKQLSDSLGILFNYWGLRSICEMYATDFSEVIDNGIFMDYIPSIHFCGINRLMHGWMNEKQIEQSMVLYTKILGTIIQQRNLSN